MRSQWENYNEDLLEYLTTLTKNNYISNLFYNTPFIVISHAISSIPADVYSLTQWEEATFYLIRKKKSFDSSEEAIHFLADLGQTITESPYEFLVHSNLKNKSIQKAKHTNLIQ
ncbi:hypothetical protein [Anaerotignum sp.]|uniref:hypothetical protein n=1 Tax=Anaerotignum sp. TaxID=2039241 RepID=UPI0027154FD0|nr:hypothetical protein [Anaerotignum sp.]